MIIHCGEIVSRSDEEHLCSREAIHLDERKLTLVANYVHGNWTS